MSPGRGHAGQALDRSRHAELEIPRSAILVGLLTAHFSAMSSGSSNLSTVTTHGPIGAKPGRDLPRLKLRRGPGKSSDSFGDVLAGGQAGTMGPGICRSDVLGPLADHRDQLDLPVDLTARRQHDGGDRT
jgi:hypothetical protein